MRTHDTHRRTRATGSSMTGASSAHLAMRSTRESYVTAPRMRGSSWTTDRRAGESGQLAMQSGETRTTLQDARLIGVTTSTARYDLQMAVSSGRLQCTSSWQRSRIPDVESLRHRNRLFGGVWELDSGCRATWGRCAIGRDPARMGFCRVPSGDRSSTRTRRRRRNPLPDEGRGTRGAGGEMRVTYRADRTAVSAWAR